MLGLVGAIATTPVTLTLPGLYYARLSSQRAGVVLGYGVAVLGVCLSGLGLYATFI